MLLRSYQIEAVEAAFREWEDVQSTLLVLPTGTGKTPCACEVIKRLLPARSLFLCHREELVFQAARAIEAYTGIQPDIEMADMWASGNTLIQSPCVVATVQTLISGIEQRRYERFDPDSFRLLCCDESHHAVSSSWKTVINHFRQNPDLKVLNLTATPDRSDEEALGQVIDSVAYEYSILDAIHDGWLVPIDQQMIFIEDLDFSHIRTTAGDLNGADLAAIMEAEKNLQGVCGSTIQIIGNRQTIVFTSSVKHAEMCCEIFNRHRNNMAGWICGHTPKEKRRRTMNDFHSGQLQVLCNVGIVGEGVDVPAAEVVVMARPTKSRLLYAQQIGRVLRPSSGLVDAFDTATERRQAIANSVKKVALVIDFAGNSGRHKLITSADILGGEVSEKARELAARKARESGRPVRMDEELDECEEEIRRLELEREKQQQEEAAHRARLVAKVKFQTKFIDPFKAFDLVPRPVRGWDTGRTLSEKQRKLLLRQGIDGDSMPYGQAKQVIDTMFHRWKSKLATIKQCNTLKRFGYETKDMLMKDASALLDQLAKNGWRKVA